MKYYCKELFVRKSVRMTAGEKARDDVDAILETTGYTGLPVYYPEENESRNPFVKLVNQIKIFNSLKTSCAPLKNGDSYVVQFPLKQSSVLYHFLIRRLHAKGVHYIALIHDLETLRSGRLKSTGILQKIKMKIVELAVLKSADKLIVHNEHMLDCLAAMGVDKKKMVPLGIFDYLLPNFDPSQRRGKTSKKKPVIIAGNLRPRKAGYAYNLPTNCDFNLYGVDYGGRLHGSSKYFGAFPSDKIPYVMEGSFGLVWDGRLAETCSDIYGDYLRLNCPHKTSLYLVSGIPVAIWSKAAQADFVRKNKVGIVVDSLYDLHGAIYRVSDEEYAQMRENAERISERLREGWYTREALRRCE